jgi:hypothetical protein
MLMNIHSVRRKNEIWHSLTLNAIYSSAMVHAVNVQIGNDANGVIVVLLMSATNISQEIVNFLTRA